MGTYKKADHRLVQLRKDHYKQRTREDGKIDDILVGPYTIEQRQVYMDNQIELYLVRHPKETRAKAKTMAFQKWRRMVIATIQDEYKAPTKISQVKKKVTEKEDVHS